MQQYKSIPIYNATIIIDNNNTKGQYKQCTNITITKMCSIMSKTNKNNNKKMYKQGPKQ